MSKQKYLFDGVYKKIHYVRAWKEKREIVIQVWVNLTEPVSDPTEEWMMPGVLGLDTAIAQAVLQTL